MVNRPRVGLLCAGHTWLLCLKESGCVLSSVSEMFAHLLHRRWHLRHDIAVGGPARPQRPEDPPCMASSILPISTSDPRTRKSTCYVLLTSGEGTRKASGELTKARSWTLKHKVVNYVVLWCKRYSGCSAGSLPVFGQYVDSCRTCVPHR
jgi:hypothetical protein